MLPANVTGSVQLRRKTKSFRRVLCIHFFDYWDQQTEQQTNSVSLEALALNLAHQGRCLLLDVDSLTRRLERLEQVTQGKLWLDPSAGLKELRKRIPISDVEKVQMLNPFIKLNP